MLPVWNDGEKRVVKNFDAVENGISWLWNWTTTKTPRNDNIFQWHSLEPIKLFSSCFFFLSPRVKLRR